MVNCTIQITALIVVANIFVLSAFAMSPLNSRDAGSTFSSEEFISVVGPTTHSQDVLAITILSRYFQSKGGRVMSLISNEVSSAQKKNANLLIVGGPCANPFWEDFGTETCKSWNFDDVKGIIRSFRDNDRVILLVAGTVADDTVFMARSYMNDFLNEPAYEKEEITIYFTEREKQARKEGLYRCGNANCDPEENYEHCPSDCNPLQPEKYCNPQSCPSCGNGLCDAAETYQLCSRDCSIPTCGNNQCDSTESFKTCRYDCS